MKKRALQFAIVFLIAGAILTLLIGYVERQTIKSYDKNLPYIALGENIKNRIIQAQLRLSRIEAGNSEVTVDSDVLPLLTSSEAILQGAYNGKTTEVGEFVKLNDENRAVLKEAIFNLEKIVSTIQNAKNSIVLTSAPAVSSSDPFDSTATSAPIQQPVTSSARFKEADPVFDLMQVNMDRFNTLIREEVQADHNQLNLYSWLSILGLSMFFAGMGLVVYKLQEKSDKVAAESSAQIEQQEKSTHSLSTFIDSISAGNFSVDIQLEGDEGLSTTLLTMRDKLRENAENDRKRNWSTSGLAQIGEILRVNNNSLEELYDNILRFVVKYTKSNQGGLFLLNEESETVKQLDLVACYAFERKKFLSKKVTMGEGLVGQCFMEGERIYLLEVPQEYISITSGLGGANPNALLIVPLKVNENIYGVLELATFGKYDEYEIELVEKLAETIASTISNVRINESTRILLEKTQQQAEEMRAQEEEMRQNMEELEATQEEMRRKEKHIHEMLDSEKQRNEFKDKNRALVLQFSKSEPVMKADWTASIELITQTIGKQLRVSRVGVWRHNDVNHSVIPEKIFSSDRSISQEAIELTATKYPAFLNAIASEKIIRTKDAAVDADTRELAADYLALYQIQSVLTVPFYDNGKVCGYIACEHNQSIEWTEDHLEFIKSAAEVLTITSNSSRMNKAVTDLTQAQATLQTIIDNLPRAVFWKDKDLVIQGCNKKFANMAGLTSHLDMIGKTDFDMVWKEHAEAYRADDREVMNTRKARIDQEERNVNAEGVEFWVSTSKVPVMNNEGQVIAVLGMVEDISDRKRRETEVQAKLSELERLKKLIESQKK
jgi:PAS domain S-box-containing protein